MIGGYHGGPAIIALYLFIWVGYAVLTLIYGWGDLSKHKAKGPYKVGVKELALSDIRALVYYPIDNKEYLAKIKKKPFKYFRFKNKKAFYQAKKGSNCFPPAFLYT